MIGAHKVEPTTIETAVMKYLDDARARHLAEATITKLTTIFEKQFLKFAKDHGYRFLKDLTPDRLTAWRSTWRDEALAASKKYQRVVGFFYFCMRMKWISDNPMKSLHPPKVKQDPTLPFTAEEVNAMVSACDRLPIKGIYGEGHRNRLRAMVLLLRTPAYVSAMPPHSAASASATVSSSSTCRRPVCRSLCRCRPTSSRRSTKPRTCIELLLLVRQRPPKETATAIAVAFNAGQL